MGETSEPRVWDPFLTPTDHAHLAAVDEPPLYRFGSSPALLMIDNHRKALGDEPAELLESVKMWPKSTGMAGWKALEYAAELLSLARELGLPIVHTTSLPPVTSGIPDWRYPGSSEHLDEVDPAVLEKAYEFVPKVAPRPGEAVIRKSAPSALWQTPLLGFLISHRVDTLVVCGESTSGCVRATVVDAASYRYLVTVAEQAVYDRHEASHAMSLFDLNQKYADVVSNEEVIRRMRMEPRREGQ